MFVESHECFGETHRTLQLQRKSGLKKEVYRSRRTIAPHQIVVERGFLGWWGWNTEDVGHLRQAT
jgi:hypothetical protein